MKSKALSPLNTRLFKLAANTYEVKIASCDSASAKPIAALGEHEFEGLRVIVSRGDFAKYMQDIVTSLEKAWLYAENDTQKRMIESYVTHFRGGDVEHHKEAMQSWIKDIGPVVETNIGYIETYLDPLGVRAEFEGFVAVVDKQLSAKFNTLVD